MLASESVIQVSGSAVSRPLKDLPGIVNRFDDSHGRAVLGVVAAIP